MRIAATAFVIAVLAAPTAHGQEFFFKDGDVVVMIGDSITEQHLYSNYVEMWTVTRFPAWKLTFRNTGIGGDTSGGGNSRFQRDVLRYKPTAMTVDFGMNDGGYGGFDKGRFDNYVKGLEGMATKAKAANIRVAWITPQPLDTAEQGPTALVDLQQNAGEVQRRWRCSCGEEERRPFRRPVPSLSRRPRQGPCGEAEVSAHHGRRCGTSWPGWAGPDGGFDLEGNELSEAGRVRGDR